MPRRYRMTARASATAETRRRIADAARDVHAHRGITAASYEEIAEAAGVSAATVYRHFPTLADLIPACAEPIPVLQVATPELVASLFAGRSTAEERLDVLVTGTCDCYRNDGGWLAALRGEQETHDQLREIARASVENLGVLVRAALAPRLVDACPPTHQPPPRRLRRRGARRLVATRRSLTGGVAPVSPASAPFGRCRARGQPPPCR